MITNPKKIKPLLGWLFVLPWSLEHVGGVNEVVKNLIRCFHRGNAFVPHLLITRESNGSAEAEFVKTFYLGIWSPFSHERPLASLRSFIVRLPDRCWRLRKIIKQHNVEVINPHFPGLGSLLFVLMKTLRLFKGRVILSFHLSDIRSAHQTSGLEKKLWKLLLRKADHIIVVSDDLGKEVLALEPKVAPRLIRIYNGVDLELFSGAHNLHCNRRHDTNNGTKMILTVGALIRRKGHDVLVRAFARVARSIPEARLVIVGGDGPEAQVVQKLVDSLSITDRVTIHKNVPHERIPEFLSQAALFALASRAESFGIAIIEAAAAGVPVVCTRAAGLRELVVDQVTGRLVEIDDHVALGDTIVQMLTHPEETRRVASNFYENVKADFSWDRAYEAYVRIGRP